MTSPGNPGNHFEITLRITPLCDYNLVLIFYHLAAPSEGSIGGVGTLILLASVSGRAKIGLLAIGPFGTGQLNHDFRFSQGAMEGLRGS